MIGLNQSMQNQSLGGSTNLDDYNNSNNFSLEFSSGSPYSSGGGGLGASSSKQPLNMSLKLPSQSMMIQPGSGAYGQDELSYRNNGLGNAPAIQKILPSVNNDIQQSYQVSGVSSNIQN